MSQQSTSNADLRGMRILCIALMMGMVIFTGVVVVLNYFAPMPTSALTEYADIILGVVAVAAIGAFVFGRHSFNKKMQEIKNSSVNLSEKLNLYRAALILYMAPCEGAGIFSILLFMLTGNYWFLLITLSMLLAMAMRFPAKQKLINEMSLDWKEQQSLE
ncbi:MAG TPA: hypothetical protein VF476_09630 [Chitinophagaceae bacterium]